VASAVVVPASPIGPPDASSFEALVPARLLETRVGPKLKTVDGVSQGVGRAAAGSVTEVLVAGRGGVPVDAAAVALNVTVVSADERGYATVFPCGEAPPTASNINYAPGGAFPNAVISKVGAGGKVCVFLLQAADLVVDVNGAFP
jgi:hypothetical protein